MKIITRKILSKNSSGFVKIEATEPEDVYSIYNLVAVGDRVKAETVRNVVTESNTGATSKKRMTIRLKIEVETIEFDSQQCSLRLKGKNVEENEYVKMGQYHTLELEIGHSFSIEKDCWDSIFLEALDDACNIEKKAEIAAIVMQDGLAHICLITTSMTITKLKIEKSFPKKRPGGGDEYEKTKQKFFKEIYEGIKRYINFELIKVILIGSPGFLKDDFMACYEIESVKNNDINLIKYKSKFIKAHTSNGYKGAIDEMLSDSSITSQLGDVKAANEVKALALFHTMIASDPDRACYGPQEVLYADTHLAIDILLITDTLFKALDVKVRQFYVQLVESVRDHGGKVHIFSSLHVSGEQLRMYTGIAAILRFPLIMPDEIDTHIQDINNIKCNNSDNSGTSSALNTKVK